MRLSGAALRFAVEELLHCRLEFLQVDLQGTNSFRNALKADFFVGLSGAVDIQLVTVLLNYLATVPNFVEAQRGRRAFEEVSKTGQLVKLLFGTGDGQR